jgi:hypothetical protein
VRLSQFGTSTTNWPFVPTQEDRWMWNGWWNENWLGKPKYSEKTCPDATLSTTNATWPYLNSNLGRRGGKPATNRLSYGAAVELVKKFTVWVCNPKEPHGFLKSPPLVSLLNQKNAVQGIWSPHYGTLSTLLHIRWLPGLRGFMAFLGLSR